MDLVTLDDALDELVTFASGKTRMTELHHVGGLMHEEIAAGGDIHVNTVSPDLRLSEAWLRTRLSAS